MARKSKKPEIMTEDEMVEYIVNDKLSTGLSQRKYGERVGLHGSYIAAILSGKVKVSAYVAWHFGYTQTLVFTKNVNGTRGKNSIITVDDMIGVLRETIKKSGLSDSGWATENGYVASNVSNYLRGCRPISPSMANTLGYTRHIVYVLETNGDKEARKKARGRKAGFKRQSGAATTQPAEFW